MTAIVTHPNAGVIHDLALKWQAAGDWSEADAAEDRVNALLAGNSLALAAWRGWTDAVIDQSCARAEHAAEAEIIRAGRAEADAWNALLNALGLGGAA